MCSQVTFESSAICKCFVAQTALVWSFTSMDSYMNCQLTTAGKCLVTYIAPVRFFSIEDSHFVLFILQKAVLCKFLVKFIAYVWFIFSMDFCMAFQTALQMKCLVTYIALVLLFSSMYPSMANKIALPWKGFVAIITLVWFFSRM